jgi:hypothetical protein
VAIIHTRPGWFLAVASFKPTLKLAFFLTPVPPVHLATEAQCVRLTPHQAATTK